MTTTVHNTRHRGHHRQGDNTNNNMELSLSDLKKPLMEDGSNQTAATEGESYNHQSFDFLNQSLVRPLLADTSEISSNSSTRDRDPSIKELQNVFRSQARVRTVSGNNTNHGNNALLNDRLQNRWNHSFGSIDSSAARAGSPASGNGGTALGNDSSEEEEEQIFALPVLSIGSSKRTSGGSNNIMGEESLLDFESVCFEPAYTPELATEQDHSRRSSASARNSASRQKYASGLSTLAEAGTAALLCGKKKDLLNDISTGSKKTSTRTSTRKEGRKGKERSSRSRSPTMREESTRSKNRTRRTTSTRRRRSTRDDSPPPLVDSPTEGTIRRTRGEVRRVKSSETPRMSLSKPRRGNHHPRRTKSNDEGHPRDVVRRKSHHHQGRISTSSKCTPSLQEVAMDIDLDDITASQHSPDYFYLDDTTAGDHSNKKNNESILSSILMDDIVEAVKAKDETKKRRTNVMDNLLTMLLDDIGAGGSSSEANTSTERKPRRRVRSGRKGDGSASQSSGSTGTGTTGSGTTGHRASTSTRRRKQQSKELATN